MRFNQDRLLGAAMLCFARERMITVLCNSPLHPSEVAIVELCTEQERHEGAICLHDIMHFAGLINLGSRDIYVREQAKNKIELWLFNPDADRGSLEDFDDDPTPVDTTF